MSDITFKQVDSLMEQLKAKEAEKEIIGETLKEKNKEISALEWRLAELLTSLEREDYICPHGKAHFVEDISVALPKDENKELLWAWMREREIFDRYATVHATAFKSLFLLERKLAEEAGEDPLTFSLPGTEPATTSRRIKFKPTK